MTFTRFYALFWWLLGLVGLFGMCVEWAVLQRKNRQRAAKGIFS